MFTISHSIAHGQHKRTTNNNNSHCDMCTLVTWDLTQFWLSYAAHTHRPPLPTHHTPSNRHMHHQVSQARCTIPLRHRRTPVLVPPCPHAPAMISSCCMWRATNLFAFSLIAFLHAHCRSQSVIYPLLTTWLHRAFNTAPSTCSL